jgi:predicted nucleic acid-binding Zn ribbon protein
MSGKASHPCLVCGRQLKRHRKAKATACSRTCREELKRIGKRRRRPWGNG